MTDQSPFKPELHGDVVYPLSFAQQRLWFLDQLAPGSAAYNLPRAVRLLGILDVSALQRSLDVIVSRHETLRTTFSMVDGHPVQVIRPALQIPLSRVDLIADPEAASESALHNVLNEEAARPFDPEESPLLRAVLERPKVA